MSGAKPGRLVTLGRITGAYGIKGWVKVHSYTEPRDNILGFDCWTVRLEARRATLALESGRTHGTGIIAKLRGVDDRDAARDLMGAEIAVPREALPQIEPGEYYWADLEGLEVRTPEGASLGTVDHLLATGANDVLVVRGAAGERLVPFVEGSVIRAVDVEAGVIVADWPTDEGEE